MPVYKCDHTEFIHEGFVELLYLLCMPAEEPVLKLKCPKEFKLIQADWIKGVCFELELKEMELAAIQRAEAA